MATVHAEKTFISSQNNFHIYIHNFPSMAKKPVQISRIIYPATAEGWRDLLMSGEYLVDSNKVKETDKIAGETNGIGGETNGILGERKKI